MDTQANLSKIGFTAGLISSAAAIAGGVTGFMSILILAFYPENPTRVYGIFLLMGVACGGILSYSYLSRNRVNNLLLITVLGNMFAVVLPFFGGFIAFPVLTMLLGKTRQTP